MKINDMLKIMGNKYAAVAADGIAAGDVASYYDTGSYALNALISGSIFGGMPSNKSLLVGAPSSTGKTFIALGTAAGFQQPRPNSIVVIFESESAITQKMLISHGLDVSRTLIVPVQTVEEFRTQALRLLKEYQEEKASNRAEMFFVLDSMGGLSTNKELADMQEGDSTRDMTRAQLLKATFRALTLELGKANVPLFVTNHIYEAIGQGPYAPAVQSGGTGAVYAASTELRLTKAKDKDADGKVSGVIVTVTAHKSRLTKEGMKVKMLIRQNGGLDRYYGLTEIAEEAGIFAKVGNKYELPNTEKVFGKALKNNPEKYFTQEVLNMIDEYVKTNFVYGAGSTEENEEGDE